LVFRSNLKEFSRLFFDHLLHKLADINKRKDSFHGAGGVGSFPFSIPTVWVLVHELNGCAKRAVCFSYVFFLYEIYLYKYPKWRVRIHGAMIQCKTHALLVLQVKVEVVDRVQSEKRRGFVLEHIGMLLRVHLLELSELSLKVGSLASDTSVVLQVNVC
jgi:hypothetical protein